MLLSSLVTLVLFSAERSADANDISLFIEQGHTHQLVDATLSPDGRLLYSLDKGGTLIVWQVASGRTLARLERHRQGAGAARITAFSLAPKTANALVVTARGEEKDPQFWLETWDPLLTRRLAEQQIAPLGGKKVAGRMTLSSDGTRFATCSVYDRFHDEKVTENDVVVVNLADAQLRFGAGLRADPYLAADKPCLGLRFLDGDRVLAVTANTVTEYDSASRRYRDQVGYRVDPFNPEFSTYHPHKNRGVALYDTTSGKVLGYSDPRHVPLVEHILKTQHTGLLLAAPYSATDFPAVLHHDDLKNRFISRDGKFFVGPGTPAPPPLYWDAPEAKNWINGSSYKEIATVVGQAVDAQRGELAIVIRAPPGIGQRNDMTLPALELRDRAWNVVARFGGRTINASIIAVSPSGQRIAATYADGATYLWDLALVGPTVVHWPQSETAGARQLSFIDDTHLLMLSFDEVRARKATETQAVWRLSVYDTERQTTVVYDHSFQDVSQPVLSVRGDVVMKRTGTKTHEIYRPLEYKAPARSFEHEGAVIALDRGASQLVAKTSDAARPRPNVTLSWLGDPALSLRATIDPSKNEPKVFPFWWTVDLRADLYAPGLFPAEWAPGTFLGIAEAKAALQPGRSPICAVNKALYAVPNRRGDVEITDSTTHMRLALLAGHSRPVNACAFSEDGAVLVTYAQDASVRVWKVSTGESLVFVRGPRSWIALAKEGTFDGSRNAAELVTIKKGDLPFAPNQFAASLNRPDKLASAWGFADPATLAHMRARADRRAAKQPADLLAPLLDVESAVAEGDHLRFTVSIEARTEPVTKWVVAHQGGRLPEQSIDIPAGKRTRASLLVPLIDGQNVFELSALSQSGVESLRAVQTVQHRAIAKRERRAFIVTIGVSSYDDAEITDLGFAHKDAADVAKVFSDTLSANGYKVAPALVLANVDVDASVHKRVSALLNQAQPSDAVVLFIAGHGLHEEGPSADYYFLDRDAVPNKLADTAVPFAWFEQWLSATPARTKWFFMDTCESGALDDTVIASAEPADKSAKVRGVRSRNKAAKAALDRRTYLHLRERFLYLDLAQQSGAVVFSSSRGGEYSFESAQVKNGYFTHALTKALGTKTADADQDQHLSLAELSAFLTQEVAASTGALQNPTVDRDNPLAPLDLLLPKKLYLCDSRSKGRCE